MLAAGGVLLLVGVVVGGYRWVVESRKGSASLEGAEGILAGTEDDAREDPACLIHFRTSLKTYVDAGTEGSLTADIVGRLVADLDAVQACTEEGKAIVFTMDELLPFFELVTAHTPVLAAAYDVTLAEHDEVEEGVVISLRWHLDVQKAILSGAA